MVWATTRPLVKHRLEGTGLSKPQLALAELREVALDLGVAHRLERGMLPAWLLVLVDEKRPDAFEEIMPGHDMLGHAIFERQRLLERHAAAELELAESDLEAQGRGAAHCRQCRLGPILGLALESGDDPLDRIAREAAIDCRLKRRQLRWPGIGSEACQHAIDLSACVAQRPVERGERVREIGQPVMRHIMAGEAAIERVGRAQSCAGEREVTADAPGTEIE